MIVYPEEEKDTAYAALHVWDIVHVITEFQQYLENEIKYNEDLTPSQQQMLETVREKFFETLEECPVKDLF